MILKTAKGVINTNLIYYIDIYEESTQGLPINSCYGKTYSGGLNINGNKICFFTTVKEDRVDTLLSEVRALKDKIVEAMENENE